MHPDQPPASNLPPGTSVASGQTSNQYDFIMNPAKPKKRFSFGGGSPKQNLLMIIAAGGLLLVVIALAVTVLLGGPNNADKLVSIAQQQQEIIRVADVGTEKAQGTAAKNLAATTRSSIYSSQSKVVARLKTLGKNVKTKELGLKMSKATDQTLNSAALNNRFDEVFTDTIQKSLVSYRAALRQLYDSTSNQTDKQLLAMAYSGAGILLDTEPNQPQ